MTRRRDDRLFGPGPYVLGLRRDPERWGSGFPFDPDARIYELTEDAIGLQSYDDLDAVRLTRGFLEAPERYIAAALDELDY